jgi:protease-4
MKKKIVLLMLLLSFVAIFVCVYVHGVGIPKISKEKIQVIYVQGEITTGMDGFGFTSSERVCKNIRDANEDLFVKAIVLRIDSPGGSPAAAEEIINEMKKVHKPIVVSMGDVAASGAYYISVPADVIVANPDTMTGGIGVTWIFENKEGYFQEEGINYTIIKSDEMKDMGAPWRNLTEAEMEYATQVVMDCYERFVQEIAIGRNMSVMEVQNLSDGRIYLGDTAKACGLIDELGNLYDAIDIAANLSDVKKPTVEYTNEPKLFDFMFNELNPGPHGKILCLDSFS